MIAKHSSRQPSPVSAEIANQRPFQRSRRMSSLRRVRASAAGSMSVLLSTSQRGLSYSAWSYFFSSLTMARASVTGSALSSNGAMSTRCSSSRVRARWRRNWWPSPAPSAAPSIRPGMSATTKLAVLGDAHHAEVRVAAW